MSWETYQAKFFKDGKIDIIAEINNSYNWTRYSKEDPKKVVDSSYVVKAKMVGSTYYGAVEYWSNETGLIRYGLVCLTRRHGYIYYDIKEMSENVGPCYYQCPKSILKELTPTKNELANNWRKKCEEYHNAPKRKINKLNIGSKISFITPYDLKSGHKKGETVTLEKYSKDKWSVHGSCYSWAQKAIPEYFTIDYAA